MNKFGYLLATTALVGVAGLAGTADAASSKFAADISETTIIPLNTTTDVAPFNALEINIHTGSKKDLLIGVSLETQLFTRTKVKGKKGSSETSTAKGTVTVCVEVDGIAAPNPNLAPDCVTFDKREQTLSATFGGVIETCEDTLTCTAGDTVAADCAPGSDGIITVAIECVVTDEDIELILDTMSAHHFNYVVRNLAAGDHVVKVLVSGDVDDSGADGEAKLGVGQGSLTVEEVRATNNPDGINFK